MNRSFRAPERGQLRSLRLRDNKDDELALFREMRKREKERNELLLLQNSDEFDAPLGPRSGSSPIFNITSGTTGPPVRKNGADDFLNSDNDKNDYDWLLTPPGTPLFPSLEMEGQKTVMNHLGTPKARPTGLKSRLANVQSEPAARSNLSSRQQVSSPGLNTSTGGLRRPTSSGGPGSRPATPTGRPTVSSISNKHSLTASVKTTSNATSKVMSTTTSKPSRSSTPTSRPTLAKPAGPPRSSTPTARSSVRSSTPTSRTSIPASKSTSRASTPTRRPTTSTATKTPAVSLKSPTTSSVAKPIPTASKNPMQARLDSPTVRPRPWKPSEMPGFSLDAPPNLRTSLSNRPPSATRGRPGALSSRSSSIEPTNGRIRRQSCSPARGRAPNGMTHNSGSSVPVPASRRLHAKASDNVSPALVGTKMVERVINMRKLAPPKQDDKHFPHNNLSGKSSSPDSAGFGRTLSKKSLDMAMRHMDIRRTIPGNLRPLMTNIPASSMYSVRPGTNRRTTSISDSPLATSSNCSSELSVNNGLCMDGGEADEDVSSDKCLRSPGSLRGR
ncbi:nuclear pore complex protein-like protein [Salvia divinorum]|uniref:Nuclear pore complex protein-like protein n=1 Tax=Salvia divinorum TaxID=28513 RepID=A0ABD1GKX3_SALDI